MRFCGLFVLLLLGAENAAAEVRAVDGDSLVAEGRRVRLLGIDAPEYAQTCGDARGCDYPCGREALAFLQKLIASEKVECRKKQQDIYKRDLSICYAGGRDINRLMLENGWAVVYRSDNPDYLAAEENARRNKRGIWQGKFMKPELYRILMK